MYMYRSLYIVVDAVLGGSIATGVGDLSTGEGIGHIDRISRGSVSVRVTCCVPHVCFGGRPGLRGLGGSGFSRFRGFRVQRVLGV